MTPPAWLLCESLYRDHLGAECSDTRWDFNEDCLSANYRGFVLWIYGSGYALNLHYKIAGGHVFVSAGWAGDVIRAHKKGAVRIESIYHKHEIRLGSKQGDCPDGTL
jgi:hypothetical protein